MQSGVREDQVSDHSTGFGVAALQQVDGGLEISFLDHLGERDANLIATALGHIKCLEFIATYTLVNQNFEHLVSVVEFHERVLSRALNNKSGSVTNLDASFAIMGAVINWLSAFRLFLDHEQTRLTREYGKGSRELKAYVAAASAAFDDSVAYRFLYRFRNYVIHCGLPLTTVKVDPPDEAARHSGAKQTVRFMVSRDYLLANFDWGKVRDDLSNMDPEFQVVSLIREVMPLVRKIMICVLANDVRRAAASARNAWPLVSHLAATQASQPLALVRISRRSDTGGYSISPMPLHLSALEKLAYFGPDDDPSTLLSPSDRPREASPIDPAVLYRIRHGVSILSAWLKDGGTPSFFAAVEDIVSRDEGSIEPLATGVLNVAATLLESASKATGVSSATILGRLADDGKEFIY